MSAAVGTHLFRTQSFRVCILTCQKLYIKQAGNISILITISKACEKKKRAFYRAVSEWFDHGCAVCCSTEPGLDSVEI